MLGPLQRYRFAFFLTAAAASWGIATAISKRAVDEIPPTTLLPVQLSASVLALALVFTVNRSLSLRGGWSPSLRRLGALGILNPGVAYALSLFGLARISASLSVLLWTLEPLLILLLARWVLGDRITTRLAGTMVAAMLGVILVVAQAGVGGDVLGVALTLAGVGACAVYTVICRKLLVEDSALTVVLLQQACALAFAVTLFVAVQVVGGVTGLGEVSARAWVIAITSGVLYYAVAFCFYLAGLRNVSAATAGLFLNLIPLFGIGAAYLLLGEHLTGRQWLGAAIVVVSVTGAAVLSAPSSFGRARFTSARGGSR
jgi:probable blue pigment (indigoidine) exporter